MVDPDSGHEHESLPSYLSHVLTARVPREEWGVDPSFWCVCTVAVDGRTDGGIESMVSPGADARLEICNPDSLIKEPKDSTAI